MRLFCRWEDWDTSGWRKGVGGGLKEWVKDGSGRAGECGGEEYRRGRDGSTKGTSLSGVEVVWESGRQWVGKCVGICPLLLWTVRPWWAGATLWETSVSPAFQKHMWQCSIFWFSDNVLAVQWLSLNLPVLDYKWNRTSFYNFIDHFLETVH